MILQRSIKIPTGPVIKRILVRCSVTAKLNVTGQTIEESRFASMRLTNNKLTCTHCGQVHHWAKKDVILAR
jgi:hypothetical protein